MMILIYFWLVAKTVAGSYMRVTMGDLLVWALKLDPSLHQDTIGELSSSAFNWCNENIVIPEEIYTSLIFKVKNVARSYRFWLCPDNLLHRPGFKNHQGLKTRHQIYHK
jgi:hypothetical protein